MIIKSARGSKRTCVLIWLLKKITQPRKGKWLINPDGYYPYCSECGAEPEGRKMTKFCPECGTPMTRR